MKKTDIPATTATKPEIKKDEVCTVDGERAVESLCCCEEVCCC